MILVWCLSKPKLLFQKKKTQHISYECGWRTNRKPGSLRKQHSKSKYNWVLLKRGKNLCFNYSRYQGKSSWKIHFLFVKDSHFLSHKFAGNTITRCVLSWGNIPLRYTQKNLLIPIFPALLLISQEDPCIGEHTQS